MDVYVYLIFALSIIPGLASACYIYDYTMLILTKKEVNYTNNIIILK